MINRNYPEGVEYMKDLVSKLGKNQKKSFSIGPLVINYPGKKKAGDYRLTINGNAPKHTDVVREIYNATSVENLAQIITFLDDVYAKGLQATSTVFSRAFIEKIYWITLQEEINYPYPLKGRKLAFQRFYEGALAKVLPELALKKVERRTNNHDRGTPKLIDTKGYPIPSFYN